MINLLLLVLLLFAIGGFVGYPTSFPAYGRPSLVGIAAIALAVLFYLTLAHRHLIAFP